MKTKDLLKILRDDGWYETGQVGSHKQFIHDTKKGKVTVPFHGNGKDVKIQTLRSILKQAGLS